MRTLWLLFTAAVSDVVVALARLVFVLEISRSVLTTFVVAVMVFSVEELGISLELFDTSELPGDILSSSVVDVLIERVTEPSTVPLWLAWSIALSVAVVEVCFMAVCVLTTWVDAAAEVLGNTLSLVFLNDATDVFDIVADDVMRVFFSTVT